MTDPNGYRRNTDPIPRKTRSTGMAYLLLFVMCHRLYLGRTRSGAVMLLLTLIALPLYKTTPGIAIFIFVSIWQLVDAFFIPGWVRQWNEGRLRPDAGARIV